jgi:hypothetical protein
MQWIGGTQKARILIDELLKSGDLIDFYSEDYFKKINNEEFNINVLNTLIKLRGDSFLHHLLIASFHSNNTGVMSLLNLCGISGSNNNLLNRENEPSFLFINLKTQQILLLGLWKRKANTIESLIYSASKYLENNFQDLDYLRIVDTFRNGLELIAEGIYPTLDGYSDSELNLLYKGNNGNYFEDEKEANETPKDRFDLGMTQNEINERYEELEKAAQSKRIGEESLQLFFSEFTADFYCC